MSVTEREGAPTSSWPPSPEVPEEAREALREQVYRRRVRRLVRRAWRRRLLNAFILWHIGCVTLWLLPYSAEIVQRMVPPGYTPVRCYLTFTGFMQGWNMFSPNPDNLDVWPEAHITYADGSTKVWVYPRMVKMGYVERYKRERFRKWVEVSTHNGTPLIWREMARYAARINNTRPHDPPVSVALWMHDRIVPPPPQAIPPYNYEPYRQADPVTHKTVPFVLTVTPEDLR